MMSVITIDIPIQIANCDQKGKFGSPFVKTLRTKLKYKVGRHPTKTIHLKNRQLYLIFSIFELKKRIKNHWFEFYSVISTVVLFLLLKTV